MTKIKMKRHELWRHNYRQARDLDHLLPEELSERFHDCTINSVVRTEREKLALRPVTESESIRWLTLITEVLEECQLRNYAYPYPLDINSSTSNALEHFFDPIPDIDQVIEHYDLGSKPYLLKFGNPKYLRQALEYGRLRISPASYYDSDEHNYARLDNELERFFKLNPRNKIISEESLESTIGNGQTAGWTRIASPADYLLYSMCSEYSSRLFGDFNSDACLVIFDPEKFLDKLISGVRQSLSGWDIESSHVSYYDPIRTDPKTISVPKFKPFRHTYQNEMRLICIPPKPVVKLQHLEIEIGSLTDCALLVDLSSHPSKPIPYDPLDDPIQIFGSINPETAMVNHLPDAARIEGILLDKTAPEHKDWFFLMQYTDSNGSWHELKIPMLDGLYLLNLLNTAQEEQGLSLWNREP